MKICIVIPIYNEEKFLESMLLSLVNQSKLPERIILVNDNSTDGSLKIVNQFSKKYHFIETINLKSKSFHSPGSKVISAFYKGFETLTNDFDIIGKFDADIILPSNYLESITNIFKNNPNCGMASGNLFIEKNGRWIYENISKKTKVRGPIKLYRKECFKQIGGLKKSMGWDTVDELLARYHGWEVITDQSLKVKHLKPTGATYSKAAKYKQGEAFKKMRYGFLLTLIATTKLAFNKRSFVFFVYTIIGFLKAENTFIVSKDEGRFIRNYRWKNIKKKLFK